MSTILWWGYRHMSGTVHAKRYHHDPLALKEAHESDFCAEVVEPFEAVTREDALRIVTRRTQLAERERLLLDGYRYRWLKQKDDAAVCAIAQSALPVRHSLDTPTDLIVDMARLADLQRTE